MDQGGSSSPGRASSAPPAQGSGAFQSSGPEEDTSDTLRNVTAPLTVNNPTPSNGTDDIAIVAPAQVLATGAVPVTGVMSPRSSPSGRLDWRRVRAPCATCGHLLTHPAICACCGIYGHDRCLSFERFQDYDFCGECIPRVTAEYAEFQNSQLRASWRQRLTEQACSWQQRAIETIGLSTTIGVAIGGTIATVAGAAAGLATGAVAGASATRTAAPGPAAETSTRGHRQRGGDRA